MIKAFLQNYRYFDKKILHILKIGLWTSFIICIISAIILLTYMLFYTYPSVFYTGIFGIIIGLIGSYLSNKKIYLSIIVTLLIMISFMGIIPNKILFLFPGYYISSYHIFSSFVKNILFSIVYLVLSFVLFFVLYRRKWRNDIL